MTFRFRIEQVADIDSTNEASALARQRVLDPDRGTSREFREFLRLSFSDNRVRDQNVSDARVEHHFRLTDLRDRDPLGRMGHLAFR